MDLKTEGVSRRSLVTHLGAGITGAALTTAVPAAEAQTSGGSTAAPFVDPTSKYPKPSYPGQSQPWPGLASKVNSRPVSGGATQEHLIHFGEKYPLRRAGQPAELASIYVQLAANDASYTTGNIYVAGGGGGQP